MKKWNRKLGTSKREQGITTPKKPPLKHTIARQNQSEKAYTLSDHIELLKKRG